jgi:hypothetical protein
MNTQEHDKLIELSLMIADANNRIASNPLHDSYVKEQLAKIAEWENERKALLPKQLTVGDTLMDKNEGYPCCRSTVGKTLNVVTVGTKDACEHCEDTFILKEETPGVYVWRKEK